jgi:Ca-activated chloride channel family protein
MRLNALLDVDVVALEAEDQISVVLELVAPGRDSNAPRPPTTLEVVLDRSGSMADGRLEAAKDALEALISRLDPADNFGLVTFDDTVEVTIPAGPIADKDRVGHVIRSVWPGSLTNLSGGYLRGAQEARRVDGDRGATLLLLSDGHANVGVTDHAELERIATAAQGHGVNTSTVGLGLGYDEALMAAVARGGGGNTHFAEEGDTAGAVVASEVEDLLDQVVQAASLTVRPTGDVAAIHLFNDLPAVAIDGGFMVELGDFYAGEERKLLLTIDVPALPGLGLAQVCQLELAYVDVASLDTETVTIPVHVNVVPGDEAAGRIPNPTVRTELAFQRAQRAKKDAAEAIRAGDADAASRLCGEAGRALEEFKPMAAPAMASEIAEEADLLRDLADRALYDDASRTAKFTEEDRHYKERKRGRHRPPQSGDTGSS